MKTKYAMLAACLFFAGQSAGAASLDLDPGVPHVSLVFNPGSVSYLDLGLDEGELSAFDVSLRNHSVTANPFGDAFLSFIAGFSIADPTDKTALTGGFDVVDDNGLYLSGDLADVGFYRSAGASQGFIELLFGNISGAGEAEWTRNVLMTIMLNDYDTERPFSVLQDGEDYSADLALYAVGSAPAPIPLPAGSLLLITGLGALVLQRRRVQAALCRGGS